MSAASVSRASGSGRVGMQGAFLLPILQAVLTVVLIVAVFLPFVTWYPIFGFPPSGQAPSEALIGGLDRDAVIGIIIAVGALQVVRMTGLLPRATRVALLASCLVVLGFIVYEGWQAGPRVAGWDGVTPASHAAVTIAPPWSLDVGFYVFLTAAALLVLSAAVDLYRRLISPP